MNNKLDAGPGRFDDRHSRKAESEEQCVEQPQRTHSILLGYLLWIFGFIGAHRFYYGKQVTGVIWFFTFGLLLVGWIIDLFLIPSLEREAEYRFVPGPISYDLTWILLTFLGLFGVHRFYMGKRDRVKNLSPRLRTAMQSFYSIILATTPAPTVRPPSRIAKRSPSSIAIGAIKVATICTLSPGITISTPSGNSQAPVTSVVRK